MLIENGQPPGTTLTALLMQHKSRFLEEIQLHVAEPFDAQFLSSLLFNDSRLTTPGGEQSDRLKAGWAAERPSLNEEIEIPSLEERIEGDEQNCSLVLR